MSQLRYARCLPPFLQHWRDLWGSRRRQSGASRFVLLVFLDFSHIDLVDPAVGLECDHGGVPRRLTRKDGGRNDPDHIPCIPFTRGAAPGGDEIAVSGTDQDAAGHFIEEIPAFEVADSTDGVLDFSRTGSFSWKTILSIYEISLQISKSLFECFLFHL